jgi:hypothetical protein
MPSESFIVFIPFSRSILKRSLYLVQSIFFSMFCMFPLFFPQRLLCQTWHVDRLSARDGSSGTSLLRLHYFVFNEVSTKRNVKYFTSNFVNKSGLVAFN